MRTHRNAVPRSRTLISLGLALATTACSNSGNRAPEARLGNPVVETSPSGDRNGLLRYNATAPGTMEDFKSAGMDIVYFASDSEQLTPEAKQTLQNQARWLRQYASQVITIEGHADERGTREYNIALGARRAEAVKNFLAAQGIAAARMRTLSYGKERPIVVCNDISCWSRNRRAQTIQSSTAVSRR